MEPERIRARDRRQRSLARPLGRHRPSSPERAHPTPDRHPSRGPAVDRGVQPGRRRRRRIAVAQQPGGIPRSREHDHRRRERADTSESRPRRARRFQPRRAKSADVEHRLGRPPRVARRVHGQAAVASKLSRLGVRRGVRRRRCRIATVRYPGGVAVVPTPSPALKPAVVVELWDAATSRPIGEPMIARGYAPTPARRTPTARSWSTGRKTESPSSGTSTPDIGRPSCAGSWAEISRRPNGTCISQSTNTTRPAPARRIDNSPVPTISQRGLPHVLETLERFGELVIQRSGA